MPTDVYPKHAGIRIPPSSQQQWSGRPRGFLRYRALAILALIIVGILWYNRGGSGGSAGLQSLGYGSVDWTKFAYSQYATDGAHLCNAVMVFEALHRLGSRADRILFYPTEWDLDVSSDTDRDSQLLVLAQKRYKVKLIPINMQSVRVQPTEEEDEIWDFSINTFHAWNQTRYKRILHINSGITLFQHMDDLFFLPDAPVAMPRAYWQLPKDQKLASTIVLLKPSNARYESMMREAYTTEMTKKVFDEEILNDYFWSSALVLPQREFALQSDEFRKKDHSLYLGGHGESWDPHEILKRARFVKFADDPLPKPWVMWPTNLLAEILPKCKVNPGTAQERECQDRDVWKGLYNDFRQRRKVRKLCDIVDAVWLTSISGYLLPVKYPGS
jgi:hypothetical protein